MFVTQVFRLVFLRYYLLHPLYRMASLRPNETKPPSVLIVPLGSKCGSIFVSVRPSSIREMCCVCVASVRPSILVVWPAGSPRVAGVLFMAYSNAPGHCSRRPYAGSELGAVCDSAVACRHLGDLRQSPRRLSHACSSWSSSFSFLMSYLPSFLASFPPFSGRQTSEPRASSGRRT